MRALLVVVLFGCGAGEPPPARSELDIGAWEGERAPVESTAVAAAEPIELDGGETFRELLALSRADGPSPQCALYSIRMNDGSLEEGQLTIDCPSSGAIPPAEVPFAAVEGGRATELRRALSGAAIAGATPDAPAEGPVVVRLLTDRRSLEGRVPDPRWPAPYATAPEAPRGAPPGTLAELWEALMYPERYGR